MWSGVKCQENVEIRDSHLEHLPKINGTDHDKAEGKAETVHNQYTTPLLTQQFILITGLILILFPLPLGLYYTSRLQNF
jgi:hypothetical protein